jgi:hypothetical protein
VTAIEGRTFCRCSGLTKLVIPSSVTTIGTEAFRDCSGLRPEPGDRRRSPRRLQQSQTRSRDAGRLAAGSGRRCELGSGARAGGEGSGASRLSRPEECVFELSSEGAVDRRSSSRPRRLLDCLLTAGPFVGCRNAAGATLSWNTMNGTDQARAFIPALRLPLTARGRQRGTSRDPGRTSES